MAVREAVLAHIFSDSVPCRSPTGLGVGTSPVRGVCVTGGRANRVLWHQLPSIRRRFTHVRRSGCNQCRVYNEPARCVHGRNPSLNPAERSATERQQYEAMMFGTAVQLPSVGAAVRTVDTAGTSFPGRDN
jgi:hypothetical protein